MRKILFMLSLCASFFLAGAHGIRAEEPAISRTFQVAGASDCQKRCQAQENQCRMASKDLDSSSCAAKFLACIQSCRGR
ncbi:MAG: hypothetical protein R3D51_12380 [Hyphomicrobiaceae bacterium]